MIRLFVFVSCVLACVACEQSINAGDHDAGGVMPDGGAEGDGGADAGEMADGGPAGDPDAGADAGDACDRTFGCAPHVEDTFPAASELVYLKDVARDAVGNLYVTGYARPGADVGGGPLPITGVANEDVLVASYTAAGELRWARTFDDEDGFYDQGDEIAVAGDRVVFTAHSGSAIDFGDGLREPRVFLVSLIASTGALDWSLSLGDGHDATVATDTAGNIYVGTASDETVAGHVPVDTTYGDGLVVSYSPAGVQRWIAVVNSDTADEVQSVSASGDRICAGGNSSNGTGVTIDFGRGPMAFGTFGGLWIACWDLDGELLWNEPMNVTVTDEAGTLFGMVNVAVGAGGEVFAGVSIGNATVIDGTAYPAPPPDGSTAFVSLMASASGDVVWQRGIGAGVASSVAVDGTGGAVFGATPWAVTPMTTLDFGGGHVFTDYLGDALVYALDGAGDFRWLFVFEGSVSSSRAADGLVTGPDGRVYVIEGDVSTHALVELAP